MKQYTVDTTSEGTTKTSMKDIATSLYEEYIKARAAYMAVWNKEVVLTEAVDRIEKKVVNYKNSAMYLYYVSLRNEATKERMVVEKAAYVAELEYDVANEAVCSMALPTIVE